MQSNAVKVVPLVGGVFIAPPARVFELLTTQDGLRSWWTAASRAAPEVGHVNVFGFDGGKVEFHFRVDEHASPRHIA